MYYDVFSNTEAKTVIRHLKSQIKMHVQNVITYDIFICCSSYNVSVYQSACWAYIPNTQVLWERWMKVPNDMVKLLSK